jgi:uroporphyrinogen decarboxylase
VTGLERVMAALTGSSADRRAVAPLLSLYGSRLAGIPTERYYRDPASYAEGQAAVAERFDPDILFGPFSLALEAEAFGAELQWPANAPPIVRRPPLSAEAAEYPRPTPESSASLAFMVEAVSRIAAASAGRVPAAAALTAPTDLPALLFGIDSWLEILLFRPIEAARILRMAEDHFVALASAFLAAGAAFVVVPVMFANPAILTDTLVATLTVPALSRAFARVPGPVVFHHGANPLADRIGLFSSLPQVAGFALDESDESARARAELGPDRLILGGPCGPNLRRRAPREIREDAERRLRERADDPRFVLITSAADVPWDTPEENIDALLDAARAGEATRG